MKKLFIYSSIIVLALVIICALAPRNLPTQTQTPPSTSTTAEVVNITGSPQLLVSVVYKNNSDSEDEHHYIPNMICYDERGNKLTGWADFNLSPYFNTTNSIPAHSSITNSVLLSNTQLGFNPRLIDRVEVYLSI